MLVNGQTANTKGHYLGSGKVAVATPLAASGAATYGVATYGATTTAAVQTTAGAAPAGSASSGFQQCVATCNESLKGLPEYMSKACVSGCVEKYARRRGLRGE